MASLGLSNCFQGAGSPHTNSRTERALIQIRIAILYAVCSVYDTYYISTVCFFVCNCFAKLEKRSRRGLALEHSGTKNMMKDVLNIS